MSDEPLFCRACGAEDWTCGHGPEDDGPFCEVCGVIPKDPTIDCQTTDSPCEPADEGDR